MARVILLVFLASATTEGWAFACHWKTRGYYGGEGPQPFYYGGCPQPTYYGPGGLQPLSYGGDGPTPFSGSGDGPAPVSTSAQGPAITAGTGGSPPVGAKDGDFPEKPVAYVAKNEGFTYAWGAFDLGAKREGILIIDTPFPVQRKLVRFGLDFYGPYFDKQTGIQGTLYSGVVNGEKLWFLIGDRGGDTRDFVIFRVGGKIADQVRVNYGAY